MGEPSHDVPVAEGKELATLLLAMKPTTRNTRTRGRTRPVSMWDPAWKKSGKANYVASDFNGGSSNWSPKQGGYGALFNPTDAAKETSAAPVMSSKVTPSYNGGGTTWNPARKNGGPWFPFFSQIQRD